MTLTRLLCWITTGSMVSHVLQRIDVLTYPQVESAGHSLGYRVLQVSD
jgi:hypothetical protein